MNLMMAAILKCAILVLANLHKTLTQTNSIWLIWWWEPSWILPSGIQPFSTKKLHSFILTQLDDGRHLEFYHLGFSYFAQNKLHSFILTQLDDGSHLEILPCWIQTLPSWIQTPCYLLSDSLKNTLTPIWLWLKLIQSDSNSFILT